MNLMLKFTSYPQFVVDKSRLGVKSSSLFNRIKE
ncbi:hypothetical protein HNP24_000978 [Chryseobacterium sediminis]|uniref:Uncharacterized protein n=1 Tax=Chryseobacterium sediminis TaxID=1679494 RepID=A0ABR6PWI1_9FLAO|nr:hypothetical protein [Chryseobacterium sediminis]